MNQGGSESSHEHREGSGGMREMQELMQQVMRRLEAIETNQNRNQPPPPFMAEPMEETPRLRGEIRREPRGDVEGDFGWRYNDAYEDDDERYQPPRVRRSVSRSTQRGGERRHWRDLTEEEWHDHERRGPNRERRPYEPRHEFERGNPRNFSIDLKTDVPEFDGKGSVDAFVEWLQTVERVFDLKDVDGRERVKTVALRFRGYASLWWSHVEKQRLAKGKEKIRSWNKMKKLMKERFIPSTYRQDLYWRLQNLKQGNMVVSEYIMAFEDLKLKCELEEEEEHTIARFLGGLRVEIANKVRLSTYTNMKQVINLSLICEGQINEWRRMVAKPNTTTNRNINPHPYTSNTLPNPLNTSKPPSTTTLPKPNPNPQNRTINAPKPNPNLPKCFKCQGYGHIASECPTRRMVTIIEGELMELEEENEEKSLENEGASMDDEEEMLEADEGELLVLEKKNLALTQEQSSDWRRNNIFHTRCTSNGKVLNLIIDSGACDNVVAKETVEKLSLKEVAHPHPYALTWIDKKHGVKVSTRCLVPFTIGDKFKDEVWCDVVPMDACHVLLGRPWQYDRHVIYDGFKHTYSLMENGKKITLAPLSPNALKVNKQPFVPCGDKQTLRKMESLSVVLPLEYTSKKGRVREETMEVPNKVISLLNVFNDVYSNKIALGWPPDYGGHNMINGHQLTSYVEGNLEDRKKPLPEGENDAGASLKNLEPKGTREEWRFNDDPRLEMKAKGGCPW